MEDFAKALYEVRKKKGYSQAYVAEKMGVNIKTVRDLENGVKKNIRVRTLGKLERFFEYYG